MLLDSRWLRSLAAIVALAALAEFAPAVAAQTSRRRVWLAIGDSFSSGEGIPGTEPPAQGARDCRRATGNGTQARAWAVSAYDEVAKSLELSSQDFTACTGAITDDAAGQIQEAGRSSWSISSFSFGGDNIRFADVIAGCLGLNSVWGALDLTPGCDIDEARLRRRIDMLVGKLRIDPAEYSGKESLPAFYDQVAKIMAPGGDVIVVGYPNLVEEVGRWDRWRRNVIGTCEGIQAYDVGMLRSVAGYLNEQIALAVADADQRYRASGIRFHWRDISRTVYETSDGASDRHALCSRQPWLNGVTVGISSGDLRTERSFHPQQSGHAATGRDVAQLIRDEVRLDDAPVAAKSLSDAEIADAVGCTSDCKVTGRIDFDHPSWGSSVLVTIQGITQSINRRGELAVVDARRQVVWRRSISAAARSELAPSPKGSKDKTGHLFVSYNPGRYNGIIALAPVADGFLDFGSLPVTGDFRGRFYYSELKDLDGNGVFEIIQSSNDCVPNCASGRITTKNYKWNGRDYVEA